MVGFLATAAEDPVFAAVDVFTSSSGGYNTYRIPAIVRNTNGTLLAFCEGRKSSASDAGDIDIVLRRSTDNGQTWGAMNVVQEEGDTASITIGNPVPVVDETTGRIHLLFCRNNDRVFSTHSDDGGLTWSSRQEITPDVKLSAWGWYATGPGHGIQLKRGAQAGRLVVPSDHNLTGGGNGIQVVYSDDHGARWQLGAIGDAAGGVNPNENLAVELVLPPAGGGSRLYFSIRDQNGSAAGNRTEAWSPDGGSSYHLPLTNNTGLVCPVVQGSVIRMCATDEGDSTNLIVFSCPNNASARSNMSVWYSLDEGSSWSAPWSIYSGSSAYSDMVRLTNGAIGILYERDSYGKITFDEFAIDALVPNAPTNQLPQLWDGGAGPANESWQQPTNWSSNSTPSFGSGLDVIFNAAGAGNLANALGANRTLRSLIFNDLADNDVDVYLAEKVSSPATNYVLTFAAFSGNATNTVTSGAEGNFTVGTGGLGSILLANNLVVTHDGSGTLTFGRPINESVAGRSLTKAGNGVLILSQNNTYTGATMLDAGTLRVGGDTSCGTGPLILNGGTTFASDSGAPRALANNVTLGGNVTLGQSPVGTGALNFTGALDLGGTTRTLTINNANTTFTGVVSNGGLAKAGMGTLTLAGANTYTGMNTLFAGILQLGAGGASGSLADASAIAIGPNAIFQFNRSSSDVDFPNNMSGTGTILKTVGGAVEFGLTGTNTFSGTIDIQEGKIAFAGANSENGAPNVNVAAAGTLSIGGGFIGGTATIGNLSGAGRIDAAFNSGAGTRTLRVHQTTDGTFSGTMLDASSGRVLALTKIGPATLTLSGTNACTGATTVSNGALIVNGVISSSAVAVKGGATLGGTGVINGPVSVESSGTLSPGASTGTLTISNSLTLDPAATVFIELNTTDGQSARVQGLTAVTYAGTLVVSNLAGSATPPTLGQTFPIFSAVPSAAGNFAITPALAGGLAWSFNPINGLLSVVPATVTYPTNLNYSLSNGILSLTWPASHLGWIAQSNAVSVADAPGWFDIPGSSGTTNVSIIPDLLRTNVFYRLRSP